MNEGLLESVLFLVLHVRTGRVPKNSENLTILRHPLIYNHLYVYQIVDVQKDQLRREYEGNALMVSECSEGDIFEVRIRGAINTRFYYLVSRGKFRLIAIDGNSQKSIRWLLRNRRKDELIQKIKLPQPSKIEEKPSLFERETIFEREIIAICSYCSGDVIESNGIEICRNCGKMHHASKDRSKQRAKQLRDDVWHGSRT